MKILLIEEDNAAPVFKSLHRPGHVADHAPDRRDRRFDSVKSFDLIVDRLPSLAEWSGLHFERPR